MSSVHAVYSLLRRAAYLFLEAQTASGERHAQDEQEIGENGAEEGCLDDTNFILYHLSVASNALQG